MDESEATEEGIGMAVTVQVLRKADKGALVRPGDRVAVFYEGFLTNGLRFDGNYDFKNYRATRNFFQFVLGSGQVIPGWDQALANKRLGSVLKLRIPPELAYGPNGRAPFIPGNATLEFTVQLVAKQSPGEPTASVFRLADFRLNVKKLGIPSEEALLNGVNQTLIGYDTKDRMTGGPRVDLIIGLDKNDKLIGLQGADRLIGGKRKDRFIYKNVTDSLPGQGNRDVILDFSAKQGDKVDLRAIDANPFKAGNQKFRWIGKRKFKGKPGLLRFRNGLLQADLNKDRIPDLEIALANVNKLGRGSVAL
ncbi:peptidyl-prolyl cis-trans isomerase, FKBP-type domain protein [Cyanobium sp. PCC 7001]|nr:peptidyl-prolyl cis-trans isomerase, FKBP-type domain protein [Cyanobium sp. PCC 7001]